MTTATLPLAVDALTLAKLLSVRPSVVNQWVEAGIMPRPAMLGDGTQRWLVEDVVTWLEARRDAV